MMCSSSSSKSTQKFDDLQEEEIRVLYLEPGSLEEHLVGELKRASLTPDQPSTLHSSGELRPTCHSSVQYEAVSYAWESLEKPHSINIRNVGDIAITSSLFDTLRHFRYAHRPRTLWIDAICIDQNNVPERNQQVAKMADIFSAPTAVLVWLGPGEITDTLAFATMDVHKLENWDSRYFVDIKTLHDSLCAYKESYALSRSSLKADEDIAIAALRAILTISQAEWFLRLWVVQETTDLTKVKYFRGSHELDRHDLRRAFKLLADNATALRSRGVWIDRRALSDVVQHVCFSFPTLVSGGDIILVSLRYSEKRCYDPRDRVFALRRVLGLEAFDELWPDYELNCLEVYRRLVRVCLDVENRYIHTYPALIHPALTLALVGTELEPSSDPDWPSWVPRLDILSSASRAKPELYIMECLVPTQVDQDSFEDNWHAYRDLFSPLFMIDSPKLLQLQGRRFAGARVPYSLRNVPDLGPQFLFENPEMTTPSHVEIVAEWFAACCRFVDDCVPGVLEKGLEPNLINFACYPTSWTSCRRQETYGVDLSDHLKLLVAEGTDGRLDLDPKSCHNILNLAFELSECPLASRRKLWQVQVEDRTDAAWLPAETQIGDDICVIAGAPWPFVIRKVNASSYTLIGDAHIFGTSLFEALGSGRQQYDFWHGEPLGFNTDVRPSEEEDMANLTWITIR